MNTDDLEADDIVIAVMGPTGSGKSTFVCAASGCDTNAVGHRSRSFTDQANAVKFWDQESMQHIVLVDTPGFDDTFKSDLDILNLISKWLVSSYNKKKLLSGILYLHRITDNRVAGSSLKNLRVFRKLCGKDALDRVYLTTTMWDEVELNVGERRLEELKTEYWKSMISQGAQVVRCRSDDDSPRQLVRQIIFSEHIAPRLQPRLVRQPKNDAIHGGTSVPQHPPKQVPSSDPRQIPQEDDIARGGIATPQQPVDRQGSSPEARNGERSTRIGREPQPIQLRSVRAAEEPEVAITRCQALDDALPNADLPVEDKHWRTLDPRKMPQGDDVARRGIVTSQQPVNRQGFSPEARNVEKSACEGQEPWENQPGSVWAAEEPEAAITSGQELVDAPANADLPVEDKHWRTSDPRKMPQGDDAARGGIATSQQPVDGQGSPEPRNMERSTRIAREPQTIQPRSVQAAKEPEVALARGREVDDALSNAVGSMPNSFNVIIFGEAGVGKSSVINLIANANVADTSRNTWGCTLESKQYKFEVAKRAFNIWDTIGLGEPAFSKSNYLGAIEKTYALITQIKARGGLDLLLFCMRGSRVTTTMLYNYRLFFEVLCEKRIPIAVIVTHLEDENNMEDWWHRNAEHIRQSGLIFGGHACITGHPGHPKAAESRYSLELLLLNYDQNGRYPMPSISVWFSNFLRRLRSIPRSKGLRDKQKELEQLLRDRCMMGSADAERLAENLTRLHEHNH